MTSSFLVTVCVHVSSSVYSFYADHIYYAGLSQDVHYITDENR